MQRVVERGDAFRELLHTALTVNATLVGQRLGCPMAVFLTVAMGVVLYLVFKRRHWL